jgi:hypothetical protein
MGFEKSLSDLYEVAISEQIKPILTKIYTERSFLTRSESSHRPQ